MKIGYILTAYKQLDLTRQQIKRIREEYRLIYDMSIIVVSSCETPIGFKHLEEEFDNVYVIEWLDAPSPSNQFYSESISNPYLRSDEKHPLSHAPVFDWADRGLDGGFIPGGWFRYCFLAERILKSITQGLYRAASLNLDVVAHVHSDSWWDVNAETNLIKDFRSVYDNKYLMMVDCAESLENNKMLPSGFMFCPEGSIFNLKECMKYQYGFTFNEIYCGVNKNGIFNNLNQFCCAEFSSTECLLSQFAYFKLTGKNIYNYNDEVDPIYREKVKVRRTRPHHGTWDGFHNLPESQT